MFSIMHYRLSQSRRSWRLHLDIILKGKLPILFWRVNSETILEGNIQTYTKLINLDTILANLAISINKFTN